MSDFSQYGGPSQELLTLLSTLPTPPSLSISDLKLTTNQARENAARIEMQTLAPNILLQDHSIPTRDGYHLEARSYRDSSIPAEEVLPVYIHFHGGGFLFGTLESEDAICSRITLATGTVVLNVNYRHTPEWKFPTAWYDSEDAFEWTVQNSHQVFRGDALNIVIGGISAGAHLAAALAQTIKREKGTLFSSLKGQVLMIPLLVHIDCYEPQRRRLRDPSVSSYIENEFAPILPVTRLKMFNGLLHPQTPNTDDHRANPGNARAEDVTGLPPTTIAVAGLDPLRDEGLLYAELLARQGVPTDVHLFKGVPHGFRRFGEKLDGVSQAWDRVLHQGIRWALSRPPANIEVEVHVHS